MIFFAFLSLDLRHPLPPQMLNPSTQQSQASYCSRLGVDFIFFSSLPVIFGVLLASIRFLNRFFGTPSLPAHPSVRPFVRSFIRPLIRYL